MLRIREKYVFQKYHPVVIFLYLLGCIGFTMVSTHPVMLGISLFMACLYGSIWIGKEYWKRMFWMALPTGIFSLMIMPLCSHQGITPLFYINDMPVTLETLCFGGIILLLLLAVFGWFQMVMVFFNQEKILFLFSKYFPTFGLALTMILRSIPQMGQKYREVHEAQMGLLHNTGTSSRIGKAKQFFTELSTVISWSLEDSMERGISMESRGYGVARRSCYTRFYWERKDVILLLLFLLCDSFTIVGMIRGEYRVSYFPLISMEVFSVLGIIGILSYMGLVLMPLWVELVKER